MHECSVCGVDCDCDEDDVFSDAAAEYCTHECEEYDPAEVKAELEMDELREWGEL